MALGAVVVGVAAVVGAGGVALAATHDDKGSGAAPPGSALLPRVEQPPTGVKAPVVGTAANTGSGGLGVLGDLAGKVADKAVEKGLNAVLGSVAGTVTMGFQYADKMREVVTKLQGKGAGDAAAVVSGAGVGFIVKSGVEALGSKLGIPADLNRRLAQTAAVAVADPTGIVTSVKVASEAVSLGIRAIAGEKAERAVRDVVKVLDFTDSKNLVNKPIAAVATGVSAVANVVKNGVSSLFGGLFGKKK